MLDADKVKDILKKKLIDAFTEVGDEVEQQMKADCPVDTGYLQSEIGHQVDTSEPSLEFWSKAPYSLYVDKGTSTHVAQPFFEKNLLGLRGKIQAKLG